MFILADGREHFYQWDVNRKLIVTDSTITEVHFCNKTDECSLVCEVYQEDSKRVVNVPNILLQTAWDIRAYAYTGEATLVEARFKVQARTKPTDYVYTETEVCKWEQLEDNLINEVKELEEEIKQEVEDIVAESELGIDINKLSNCLKGTANGEVVLLDDISPIANNIDVSVRGKNLVDISFDKWVENPTLGTGKYIRLPFTEGQTFTVSFALLNEESIPKYFYLFALNADGTKKESYLIGDAVKIPTSTKTVASGQEYYIGCATAATTSFDDKFTNWLAKFAYIQVELGSSATAYAPYIEDLSAVKVWAQGKNLVDEDAIFTGLEFVKQEDGSYYGKMTSVATAFENTAHIAGRFSIQYDGKCDESSLSATPFTVKVTYTDGTIVYSSAGEFGVNDNTGEWIHKSTQTSAVKIVDRIELAYNNRKSIYIRNLQIELGDTATAYEPYKEPVEYTVNADGTTDGIKPILPNTTLTTNTNGAIMDIEYSKDINKAYQELYNAIISLGGNI